MTSGSILPSIGPPPPEFRRPQVPENLRPKLASGAIDQPLRQNPSAQPRNTDGAIAQKTPPTEALLRLAGQAEQQAAGEAGSLDQKAPQRVAPASLQVPPSANLGGVSAVAIQVQESEPVAVDASEQKLQGELSEEEKAAVQRLRDRDREVRAHENAHAAIGRGYTGSPSFEFARGPDGVQYAVGGHVDIDAGVIPNDPRATIAKMDVVRSAALAPARPSGQDRAVAAAAAAAAQEAQAQLRAQEKEELQAAIAGDESAKQTETASSVSQAGGVVSGISSNEEDALGEGGSNSLPASATIEPGLVGAVVSQQAAGINLLV